jgi:hypothetical protein
MVATMVDMRKSIRLLTEQANLTALSIQNIMLKDQYNAKIRRADDRLWFLERRLLQPGGQAEAQEIEPEMARVKTE